MPNGLPGAGVALGREPQDLAAERVGILRGVALLRIAGRDVQHAVRAEGDAPAVVRARARDAVEHDLGLAEARTLPASPWSGIRTTRLSSAAP